MKAIPENATRIESKMPAGSRGTYGVGSQPAEAPSPPADEQAPKGADAAAAAVRMRVLRRSQQRPEAAMTEWSSTDVGIVKFTAKGAHQPGKAYSTNAG